MTHFIIISTIALIVISVQFKRSISMHFHHSDYQVHHKMGQMKIKVKPEGAKLVFTGGDLDVHLHPAHGYVRPIHNMIVSHMNHDIHYEDDHHHEIEHEDEEVGHSGYHEWHHSYHHGEHGGHDDDGYGFRHFHHWPNSLHGEHSFLGHDFYHDHHGDHHGHFRDEIVDSDKNGGNDGTVDGLARHSIFEGDADGMKPNEEEKGPRDDQGYQRSIDNARNDAVIFGKKIYPDDGILPTFKSKIEENFEKASSRIAPHFREQKGETEEGSARGTISPFDDENDSQNNGMEEDQGDRGEDANDKSEGRGRSRGRKEDAHIKELERIASQIKPDIPSEQDELPVTESSRNTKDIGSPSRVYVNMSGEPHNYGEEGGQDDYPAPNRSFRPDIADNENERPIGDYYPNEEESWSRPHDDNEDDSEGYKKSLTEFQIRSNKISAISNEGEKRKDSNPPVVVQPDGDPRNGNLEKAFYDFHPIKHLSQHLATIKDFNVRSRIDKSLPDSENSRSNKKIRGSRRSLIADRLIQRSRKSW